MGRRTVQDAVVDDIEKWKYPSKHYVYVVHVSWSDGSVNVVYRRYSKFFDFQMKLLSLFPEESGAKNQSQRMIPFLPGKKLFGRSQTREVASKRLVQLNEYCRALVRLPSKVSDSNTVLEFFTPTVEDINPKKYGNPTKTAGREIDVISDPIQPDPYIVIADYKKQQKNEVDLHAGDTADVFEKTDSGWWFVSTRDGQGWAPASFLNREDGAEDEDAFAVTDERYITNNSYKAQQADEITFERGVIVEVVQKSLDGWWKVSFTEKVGWAPAAFLQVYTGPSDVVAGAPTERIGNVMSVSDIHKRRLASDSSGASPQPLRKDDSPIHYGTEAKPTPPRRITVRPDNGNDSERTVRKGATRKRNPTKKSPKQYYTTGDFTDSDGGSLDFKRGEQVQVVQETESGWWFVRIGDREGWAPSTFIEEQVAETRPQQPRSDVMDEETGESSPRPPRPALPPIPATKTTIEPKIGMASVGANAFRPVPLPPGRSGNSGSNSASGSSGSSDKTAFRPVPLKPGSSNNNSNSSNSSAFRPVPIPSSNAGRPLPLKPVHKSPAGSPNLRNAQANLKPTSAKAKPPPVNRMQKPVVKPAAKLRANQPSQINELKNQLEKLNPVRDSSDVKQASYVTAAPYQDSSGEGLSFDKGLDVEVLEENNSGWWLVRIGGQEGWAPSNFLDKV